MTKNLIYIIKLQFLGSTWHGRRKLIQPTFHHKILHSFIETFQNQSIVLTNEIASNIDGKEFDVSEIVAFRTLNFICGKENAYIFKKNSVSHYSRYYKMYYFQQKLQWEHP